MTAISAPAAAPLVTTNTTVSMSAGWGSMLTALDAPAPNYGPVTTTQPAPSAVAAVAGIAVPDATTGQPPLPGTGQAVQGAVTVAGGGAAVANQSTVALDTGWGPLLNQLSAPAPQSGPIAGGGPTTTSATSATINLNSGWDTMLNSMAAQSAAAPVNPMGSSAYPGVSQGSQGAQGVQAAGGGPAGGMSAECAQACASGATSGCSAMSDARSGAATTTSAKHKKARKTRKHKKNKPVKKAAAPPVAPAAAASSSSPVTAAQIDSYLTGKQSPLAGQGAAFVAAGVKNGIDPRLLVAICGIESGFGQHTFKPHNAWGYGSFSFDTWEQGINTVADGLRRLYISQGLTTVDAISKKYCPVGASNDPNGTNGGWPSAVTKFLQEQGGNPNDVRLLT